MVGETDGARSLNGSWASMDASSITHTPAWRPACRPRASRTVWWEGAAISAYYRIWAGESSPPDVRRAASGKSCRRGAPGRPGA